MEYQIARLLDEYKAARKLKNDSELAEDLKVSRAAVSRWRKDLGLPEPVILWRMAKILGMNPADLVCAAETERAANLENAEVWKLIRRMYIMSAVAAHMRQIQLRRGLQQAGYQPTNWRGK